MFPEPWQNWSLMGEIPLPDEHCVSGLQVSQVHVSCHYLSQAIPGNKNTVLWQHYCDLLNFFFPDNHLLHRLVVEFLADLQAVSWSTLLPTNWSYFLLLNMFSVPAWISWVLSQVLDREWQKEEWYSYISRWCTWQSWGGERRMKKKEYLPKKW